MSSANDTHPVLAPTPPMGWNSWDCYGASITEEEVKANADYMADNLSAFGWQYVVVDILWYHPDPPQSFYPETEELVVDQYGRVVPAVNRFPSAAGGRGFKPLADYIHARGLKFGIHIMRGIPRQVVQANLPILGASARAADIADEDADCIWCKNNWGVDTSRPGAQEYYDSIVALYAEWGVDYIKADDMSRPYRAGEIEALRAAIDRCGRPIVLSLSPGAAPLEHAEHVKRHAQLWRSSGDLWDRWGDEPEGYAGLKGAFALCAQWAPHAGPGHWPDPDMLPLGRLCLKDQHGPDRMSRLTKDEQRTMMTLWCVSRAPLMFGGDLLSMDPFTLSLLTNEEVLAVNQSSTGNRELFDRGDQIAWVADVPQTEQKYLAVFNLADEGPAPVKVSLEEVGLSGPCAVRDLWAQKDLAACEGECAATINVHGAGLYKLTPQG